MNDYFNTNCHIFIEIKYFMKLGGIDQHKTITRNMLFMRIKV